jgi:hypothetical protein
MFASKNSISFNSFINLIFSVPTNNDSLQNLNLQSQKHPPQIYPLCLIELYSGFLD